MKKGGFFSGDTNYLHDRTGVCTWKFSEKSSPFFFTTWKWGYPLLPSYPFSFCPSVSLTHTHLEENTLLGKRNTNQIWKSFYFNKKYCIQHLPWNKLYLNVANLLWNTSMTLALQQFFNFQISKFRIYCNLFVCININALKRLVKCHFFTLASFALAKRSLLQLCCPSVWVKLSSSECTQFCKALERQKIGFGFGFFLKDKLFFWNCRFIFSLVLYYCSDSF